jgi:hypothetical protein
VIDVREEGPEPVVTVSERRTSALRILRPAEAEPVAPPPEEPAATGDGDGGGRPELDDVFARLRADRAAATATGVLDPPADAEAEEADDVVLVRRRDADLAPLERDLARALKRELADEQNAVLDALRRSRSRPTLDELLPEPAAATARYAGAVAGPLAAAAAAGLTAAGGGAGSPSVEDLAGGVGEEVAAAVRGDVAAALEATGGDHAGAAERISTAYRTWKSSLAEPVARQAAVAAEARGRLTASGTVRWVADPDAAPCAACAGNAAAGLRTAGDAFPSGAAHPPAHPGCRCVVGPTGR